MPEAILALKTAKTGTQRAVFLFGAILPLLRPHLLHYTPMLPSSIDPSLCPLCGSANRCAMELERATGLPQPPCWCLAQEIPADVLERIPAPLRNKACVCARCGTPLDATPAR